MGQPLSRTGLCLKRQRGGQDKDGLKLLESERWKGWEEADNRRYEGQNMVKMKRNFQGNILFPSCR